MLSGSDVPRIRSLKPEHRQHRKIGPLTDREYRLWVGMLNEADDEGRLVADAGQLRALIWAYHPKVTVKAVEDALLTLETVGLIRLYRQNGTRYADFPSWKDHQRIDRPIPSKLPNYEDSSSISRELVENSSMTLDGSEAQGSSGKGEESNPPISPLPGGFVRFWEKYPNKVGKDDALKVWRKRKCEAEAETILAGLDRTWKYLTREDGTLIPNPATWLRQGRWKDEPRRTEAKEWKGLNLKSSLSMPTSSQ